MTYSIAYHPDCLKDDVSRLDAGALRRIKRAIEDRLISEPTLYGKPLRYALKGLWVLRVGDYRVVYAFQGITVVILRIGHRKEVYEAGMPSREGL